MGAGFGISETTRRRIYNEAIRKYRKLHPVGKIDVEELKRLMGDGTSIEPLIKDNIDKYYSDKTFGDYYLDALTPSMGNYVSASKALMDAQAYAKGGLKFERHGDYLHIFGNAEVKEYIGINSKNNRIALKNIDNFDGIADLYSAKRVFKNNAIPGVLDGVGWAFETYEESKQFEDTSDKVVTGAYNAAGTILSSCATGGIMSATTYAFTAAGTTACPVIGTAVGFILGYFVGALVDAGFDYVQDKYVNPWLAEN